MPPRSCRIVSDQHQLQNMIMRRMLLRSRGACTLQLRNAKSTGSQRSRIPTPRDLHLLKVQFGQSPLRPEDRNMGQHCSRKTRSRTAMQLVQYASQIGRTRVIGLLACEPYPPQRSTHACLRLNPMDRKTGLLTSQAIFLTSALQLELTEDHDCVQGTRTMGDGPETAKNCERNCSGQNSSRIALCDCCLFSTVDTSAPHSTR